MEIFGKNGRFSGRIWPDWGNTARADKAHFRVNITTKTKSKAKYELMSTTFLGVNLSKDDHDENVNMHKVVTNCRLLRPTKYS